MTDRRSAPSHRLRSKKAGHPRALRLKAAGACATLALAVTVTGTPSATALDVAGAPAHPSYGQEFAALSKTRTKLYDDENFLADKVRPFRSVCAELETISVANPKAAEQDWQLFNQWFINDKEYIIDVIAPDLL